MTRAMRKQLLLDRLKHGEVSADVICEHGSSIEVLRLWGALRELITMQAVQYYRKESGQYYVKLSAS